jgi:very-short-patch-repair endonuclease
MRLQIDWTPAFAGVTIFVSPPLEGGAKGRGISVPSASTALSRRLRQNATRVETILWNQLRSKQIEGLKFRRQQPIGGYIVDFVSFEKRLVVELDGGQHAVSRGKDRERDRLLTEAGYKVLRFWNNDVLQNLPGVLETIRKNLLP